MLYKCSTVQEKQVSVGGNRPGANFGVPVSWSEASKAAVLPELERILESSHFRASKKCSRFLRHVVEAAIEGRSDSLKERTLGVDVFDREPHYDTNEDPIVRGTAGEVRKRLAQFYQEAATDQLRLSLPTGSYVPELHMVMPERPAPAAAPAPTPLAEPLPAPPPAPKRVWFLVAAGLVGAFAAVSAWTFLRPSDLDRFWGPVLGGKSVLVCMGQPQFYTFRPNTAQQLNSWFEAGLENRQQAPVSPVPLTEIVPMWDKSVALADTQAFSRIANLFGTRKKQVDLRGERLVSLSDLRGKPAVLIGAFDNDWALNLTRELRFHFETDPSTKAQIIRDRQKPGASDWKLVDAWPPGKEIQQDYALVTRVLNRTTEHTIVMIGGITQYGTEAAAEFVTDPSYFKLALAHAPSDWYRKDIQIVISTRVLSGVSGPPTVEAAFYW